MTNKERTREIAGKDPRALTDEDRSFIRDLSAEMGMEFSAKKRCANCYIDQAIAIWREMAKLPEEQQEEQPEARKYALVPGTDVLYRGLRINEATLTDELAKTILSQGFPLYLFARYEA